MANWDQDYIVLNGYKYKILSYNYTDVDTFPPQRRQGLPKYEDFSPETVLSWRTWHHGYGEYYAEDPSAYYQSVGLDASVPGQITLASAVATTAMANGAPLAELPTQFIEFNRTLYAVASQTVYAWAPGASPNGWSVSAAFAPGPLGQAAVFAVASSAAPSFAGGSYLIVPSASQTNYLRTDGVWTSVASPAAHLCAIRNEIWKAAYDIQNRWYVSKSTDGLTWPNGNIVANNGTATVAGLMSYDNRLWVLSGAGIQTLDSSGTVYDLVPEVGQYGNPGLGRNAQSFHGVGYIPSDYGLLQFYGSSLVNPQVSQALKSVGPDVQSWSQSEVRGHIGALGPHVNDMFATMNAETGNGYVVRYRDFPDIQPGQGWHPIAKYPTATLGAIKVSALNWVPGRADYPILWTGAVGSDGHAYVMASRLPNENDNPLVDANCAYQLSGTLDLPIIDDQIPTFQKGWIKVVLDVTNQPLTTVQVYGSFDGGPFVVLGSVTGATGIFEYDFASPAPNVSYRLQPRIAMQTATTAQTPVVRSIAIHHIIQPPLRGRWELQLLPQEKATPNDNETSDNKIAQLKIARQYAGTINFTDLNGQSYSTTLIKLDWQLAAREAQRGSQMIASVALQDYGEANYYFDYALFDYSYFSLQTDAVPPAYFDYALFDYAAFG